MESVLTSPELLSHIFSFLNFNSIKSVRCVSRFWKQQSEYFKFWKGVKLELDEYKKVMQVSKELLNIISIISLPLCLEGYRNVNSRPLIYKKISIENCPRLKELKMCHVQHKKSDFSKNLLSIIPHLDILTIEWSMTPSDLSSIYLQIPNLKLFVSNDDHRDIPPSLLAFSLTKVETVKLDYANLTTEQLNLIYQQISSSNCNLKYLKIGYADHKKVDTELLISALSKLEELDIATCMIHFHQFMSIFMAIADDRTKLKHLTLFSFPRYIFYLPPDLIFNVRKTSVVVVTSNVRGYFVF